MNWVTVIWSMVGGACLTLALMHVVIWLKNRGAQVHLVFAVMAVSVAAITALELAMMRAGTPRQFGILMRWTHVPVFVLVVCLVSFVRLYERRLETQVYYPPIQKKLPWRQIIEQQVRHLARVILGEEASYQPFIVR